MVTVGSKVVQANVGAGDGWAIAVVKVPGPAAAVLVAVVAAVVAAATVLVAVAAAEGAAAAAAGKIARDFEVGVPSRALRALRVPRPPLRCQPPGSPNR